MSTGPLILIVEDEPQMRRFLRALLSSHGFSVAEAETAARAMTVATGQVPELVLLDLGLPDGDGIDLIARFREWTQLPILVLSARDRERDKVAALDAGADDYLTKPFGTSELLARIRVALRHADRPPGAASPVISVGPLQIDLPRRQVTLAGTEIRLTPIELKLIILLCRNAGKVLTHRQILKQVWGPGQTAETHYVRVYMAQLRRKLEADPTRPQLLLTEPGVGYKLRDPD